MRCVRWGVLGCGKVAHDFAEALRCVDGVRIVAVGSRNVENARLFAKRFEVAKCYGSYEALAADPEVEIIYVTSPHSLHKTNTILCLNQRKAVLCEKPFAINAKEVEEMIQAAKLNNVFLMEAMWTRCFPAIHTVRKLLKEGVIGDVKFVQASIGFLHDGSPNRLLDPSLGGGVLLDVGIYAVSFCFMVYGSYPTSIVALGDVNKAGYDEQVGILLAFQQAQHAVLSCGMTGEFPRDALIVGSQGRIKVHDPFWCPERISVIRGSNETVMDFPLKQTSSQFTYINSIGLMHEIEHVSECIRLGKTESEFIPLQESLHIMQCMDTIRQQIGLKYEQDQ